MLCSWSETNLRPPSSFSFFTTTCVFQPKRCCCPEIMVWPLILDVYVSVVGSCSTAGPALSDNSRVSLRRQINNIVTSWLTAFNFVTKSQPRRDWKQFNDAWLSSLVKNKRVPWGYDGSVLAASWIRLRAKDQALPSPQLRSFTWFLSSSAPKGLLGFDFCLVSGNICWKGETRHRETSFILMQFNAQNFKRKIHFIKTKFISTNLQSNNMKAFSHLCLLRWSNVLRKWPKKFEWVCSHWKRNRQDFWKHLADIVFPVWCALRWLQEILVWKCLQETPHLRKYSAGKGVQMLLGVSSSGVVLLAIISLH